MPIFETFSLKDNDIEHQIPGEEELLAAFPDLKAIFSFKHSLVKCKKRLKTSQFLGDGFEGKSKIELPAG